MWPFSSPWSKVEKQMKQIYPSDLTEIEYLRYLDHRTNCPGYIHVLMKRAYINPSKPVIAALNKWFAIMRSSSCSTNGLESKR